MLYQLQTRNLVIFTFKEGKTDGAASHKGVSCVERHPLPPSLRNTVRPEEKKVAIFLKQFVCSFF